MEPRLVFYFSWLFLSLFSTERPQILSGLLMEADSYSSSENVHQKAVSNA